MCENSRLKCVKLDGGEGKGGDIEDTPIFTWIDASGAYTSQSVRSQALNAWGQEVLKATFCRNNKTKYQKQNLVLPYCLQFYNFRLHQLYPLL